MTSELARNDPQADVRERPFNMQLIQALASGPTLPERYHGKPQDVLAVVLVGKELGVQPMEAISSLYLVAGQVSMSGKLMMALLLRAGHRVKISITKTQSTVTGFRREEGGELVEVGSITFGDAEAKQAGLQNKDTYKAYPTIMWTWRAVSQMCRLFFSDVLSGVGYIPEEVNVTAPVEAIPLEMEGVDVSIDGESINDVELENTSAVVAEILDADVVA